MPAIKKKRQPTCREMDYLFPPKRLRLPLFLRKGSGQSPAAAELGLCAGVPTE